MSTTDSPRPLTLIAQLRSPHLQHSIADDLGLLDGDLRGDLLHRIA